MVLVSLPSMVIPCLYIMAVSVHHVSHRFIAIPEIYGINERPSLNKNYFWLHFKVVTFIFQFIRLLFEKEHGTGPSSLWPRRFRVKVIKYDQMMLHNKCIAF